MPSTDWSGAPIPSGASADNVPGDLALYSDAIDPLLVLQAVDTADRDTRFALLPKGSVVVTSSPLAAWVKANSATPTWDDLLYDTGWITAGFTVQSGWSINTARIRKRGDMTDLRVSLTRTGGNITTTASGDPHEGNVADTNIIQIPSSFVVDTIGIACGIYTSFGVAAGLITTTGMLTLLALGNGGAVLATGDSVVAHGSWLDG